MSQMLGPLWLSLVLLGVAQVLFQASQVAPHNDNMLNSWATAYYWRGNYVATWQ